MFECNFSKTVGMYLSGFDLKMRAIANTNDHDSLFWVKSILRKRRIPIMKLVGLGL